MSALCARRPQRTPDDDGEDPPVSHKKRIGSSGSVTQDVIQYSDKKVLMMYTRERSPRSGGRLNAMNLELPPNQKLDPPTNKPRSGRRLNAMNLELPSMQLDPATNKLAKPKKLLDTVKEQEQEHRVIITWKRLVVKCVRCALGSVPLLP